MTGSDHGGAPQAGRGGTVLVVDDDPSLRRSVRRALEMNGYQVKEAASAHEARTLLGEGVPDLVIMDMVLPGMEGREAANLLLSRAPELRILFISGYTSVESMRMGHLREGQSFLRKPFDVQELLAAVDRIVE